MSANALVSFFVMSDNKPIMNGGERRIYGDFIREISVGAEKAPNES